MATPPLCDFGWKAPDFSLKGVDGATHSLDSLRGAKGTVIVFMCQHCPYVKAILDPLIADAAALRALGVNTIGINANDAVAYPEDSFENMVRMAEAKRLSFPYLHDETQGVARAYDAICTPDFFGFNSNLELQYRGRLDASRTSPVPGARRDLLEAMTGVAETGRGPAEQIASMGCTIKWKSAA
ncbi:MAG: thioredoxin family protein [Alphaproteobacteria bacterium]|jgi:peroxiredoxin|nr:thioredoxin family protein [Alphaproteobacteria bacterium]MDP6518130.1 thioredoxin family protein [Alphaproteobacteria bacterium]|tara:strand:- start:57 stop:608 length:552 start_codon:yes stop_codon:yes gene_type:complete